MHRTNIYLSDEQRDALDARARAEGVSRAELIRRMLDRTLQGESDRLTADLAAISGSFGALVDEEIVVDRGDGARGAHLERVADR
jgi:metal-responsive CopG/Arc/MetJ family transcriptional regulator